MFAQGQLILQVVGLGLAHFRLPERPAKSPSGATSEKPCVSHRGDLGVYYLGLVGPATNGQCDITAAYTARFGQPAPGQKVFIVTCQQKNGWKAQDHVTSAIVPPKPLADEQQRNQVTKAKEAASVETPECEAAPTERVSSLSRAMYKGSTPDAPGAYTGQPLVHPVSIPGIPLVHSLRLALGRLVRLAGGVIRMGHAFRASPAPAAC